MVPYTKMRQIYKRKRLVMPINQGSIINHCLANGYSDSASVYGLVITARCDIAHTCKVNWVHYLPIGKLPIQRKVV